MVKTTYELTKEEQAELMKASRIIWLAPEYGRAEALWRRVAERVGCKYETISRPPAGSSSFAFCAEPKEVPSGAR